MSFLLPQSVRRTSLLARTACASRSCGCAIVSTTAATGATRHNAVRFAPPNSALQRAFPPDIYPLCWSRLRLKGSPPETLCAAIVLSVCLTDAELPCSHFCVALPPGCEDNEWRCGDGICLPQDVVCDNKKDCEDGSDEANCKTCKWQLSVSTQLVRRSVKKKSSPRWIPSTFNKSLSNYLSCTTWQRFCTKYFTFGPNYFSSCSSFWLLCLTSSPLHSSFISFFTHSQKSHTQTHTQGAIFHFLLRFTSVNKERY